MLYVQLSGYGKAKICAELLRTYPGLYLVFRKTGETGIPHQPDWIKDMLQFALNASGDNLPISCNFSVEKAINYLST